MKPKLTSGLKRVLFGVIPVCGVFLGAVAYAQTSPSTTTDTLVGSALATLGSAVTVLRAEVATLQTSERVARATIAETGAILSQNGAWIGRIERPEPGTFAFTFAPGAFTNVPTCVTSPYGRATAPAAIECYDVTTKSMTCRAAESTGVSLICAGW